MSPAGVRAAGDRLVGERSGERGTAAQDDAQRGRVIALDLAPGQREEPRQHHRHHYQRAGLVLGVLYLFPLAADVISNPTIVRHLDQIGPLPAGLDAQATIGVKGLPLTPWQGLGVVALWTAGALLLGALAVKLRDA